MKKRLVYCLLVILCVALSGCAGNQRETQKSEPLEREDTRQEDRKSVV